MRYYRWASSSSQFTTWVFENRYENLLSVLNFIWKEIVDSDAFDLEIF